MQGLTKQLPVNQPVHLLSIRQPARGFGPGEAAPNGVRPDDAGLRTATAPADRPGMPFPYLNNRSPTSDDAHVGGRIKQLRRALGRTQKQIANIVGVTGAQFHRYETGSTRVAASRLIAIAAALNVRPEVLMGAASPVPEMVASSPAPMISASDDLLELVEVYESISDPRRRNALIAFARAVARGQHAQASDD